MVKIVDDLGKDDKGIAFSDSIVGLFDEDIIVEMDDDDIRAIIDTYEIPQSVQTGRRKRKEQDSG